MTDQTPATEALYAELSESPLPGARYALDVVKRRMPAIEAEGIKIGMDASFHTTDLSASYQDGRADALREAADAVRALPSHLMLGYSRVRTDYVLAILDPDHA